MEKRVVTLSVPEEDIERLGQLLIDAIGAATASEDKAILTRLWAEHCAALASLYQAPIASPAAG